MTTHPEEGRQDDRNRPASKPLLSGYEKGRQDGLREAAEIARGRWGHRAHVYSPVRHVVAVAIESRLAELEGER